MKIIVLTFALALAVFAQNPVARRIQCPAAVVGGTGDAITCTPVPAIASYVSGMEVELVTTAANTTAVTINISGLGTQAVTNPSGGIGTALVANDFRSGQHVIMRYDGTRFQVMSRLGNAAASSSVGSVFSPIVPSSGLTQSATYYVRPFSAAWGTERIWYSPVACTLRNLYVDTQTLVTSGQTLAFTVRTDYATPGTLADTSVTCTISDSSTPLNRLSCADTTNTTPVSVGTQVSFKLVSSATAGTHQPALSIACN